MSESVTTREFDEFKKNTNDNLKSVCEDIKLIKENHLPHIEKSMNNIENSHIELKTNTAWIIKFFWIVVTASLGALVSGIGTIVITLLKNK